MPKIDRYKTTATVERKQWGTDDYYHVVEVQVDDTPLGKVTDRDKVTVIIERPHKTLCDHCMSDEPEIRKQCTANCEEHSRAFTPH